MAGHSKWNNIKRKKEKTDSQRAKIFTKIGREITVAVKESGADPQINSRLRDLISKAKSNNFPNDNIERIIKKASGDGSKNNYETMVYEGYGPDGVAVIVECLSDNKNRTASEVRHHFDKYGGNLGTVGCVSFMFENKGIIAIKNNNINEEKFMEDCIESGAGDFEFGEDLAIVTTSPQDFSQVRLNLEKLGYEFEYAEISKEPSTYAKLDDEQNIAKMNKLIELLEDNDDVQNIWHNWELE